MAPEPIVAFTELEDIVGELEVRRAVEPLSPTGKWTRRDPWMARLYGPTEWRGECLVRTIGLLPKGYTRLRGPDGVAVGAHRLAWQVERGPIPEGLTIDHLCQTTGCILVSHMEVVTLEENSRRRHGWRDGTCSKGHPLENFASSGPRKRCRPCWNEYMRESRKGRAA